MGFQDDVSSSGFRVDRDLYLLSKGILKNPDIPKLVESDMYELPTSKVPTGMRS